MVYSVRLIKTFENELPGPAEIMCSHWNEWFRNIFYMVIAQSQDKTIVINTGPPRDMAIPSQFQRSFAERSVPKIAEAEKLPKALESVGIAPSSVDILVLSPFGYYTTGNLALFTKAKICILKRGWVDFMAPEPFAPRFSRQLFIDDEQLKWLVTTGWDQIRLLQDEDEIAPGVRSWFAGSHHRSSMAIEIETAKGLVIFSDAFFRYENLEKNIPIGVCECLEEALRTHDRVRRHASIVLPFIDPEIWVRYPDGVVA
jgi:glyoxylase-like metal-dependent hydrolase (beta-lactamase superfamily II)